MERISIPILLVMLALPSVGCGGAGKGAAKALKNAKKAPKGNFLKLKRFADKAPKFKNNVPAKDLVLELETRLNDDNLETNSENNLRHDSMMRRRSNTAMPDLRLPVTRSRQAPLHDSFAPKLTPTYPAPTLRFVSPTPQSSYRGLHSLNPPPKLTPTHPALVQPQW